MGACKASEGVLFVVVDSEGFKTLVGASSFGIFSCFVLWMLGVATVIGPSVALRRLLGELTIMFFIMGICKRAKSWCPFPVKKMFPVVMWISTVHILFIPVIFIGAKTCSMGPGWPTTLQSVAKLLLVVIYSSSAMTHCCGLSVLNPILLAVG